MLELAVIIVSYNTRDLLWRCLHTVEASLLDAGIDYQIVVVDNASADGTPAMLRAEFPHVRLIEPSRNLGFAGGNNAALRVLGNREQVTGHSSGITINSHVSSNLSPVSYVLLLNPDTEVVGDAIPQLVWYLETHPDVALVGPQLRYPDGSVQSSRRRFPERGVFFFESTPLEMYFRRNRWARRYRMDDVPDNVEQDVDWLVGAALMTRASVIQRAGLLDEGFAMYSEELEWQQRVQGSGVRKARKQETQPSSHADRIVYFPQALIIHHEGKSSEQALARRYAQFHQSRLRYVRMFYGPQHALGLWVFLLIVYGIECLIEAAKWIVGHKRPLRAQRVAVYAEFLRRMQQGPLAKSKNI